MKVERSGTMPMFFQDLNGNSLFWKVWLRLAFFGGEDANTNFPPPPFSIFPVVEIDICKLHPMPSENKTETWNFLQSH